MTDVMSVGSCVKEGHWSTAKALGVVNKRRVAKNIKDNKNFLTILS
jgi:hypothetical protein